MLIHCALLPLPLVRKTPANNFVLLCIIVLLLFNASRIFGTRFQRDDCVVGTIWLQQNFSAISYDSFDFYQATFESNIDFYFFV